MKSNKMRKKIKNEKEEYSSKEIDYIIFNKGLIE